MAEQHSNFLPGVPGGMRWNRRGVLAGAASLGLIAAFDPLLAQGAFDTSRSALLRIAIATIGASKPKQVANAYVQFLGYRIHETGLVSPAMAASWGAPHSAHRPYFLLNPAGYPDSFVRIVGIDPVPGYSHASSAGWSAIECIVDNIDDLYRSLQASPFKPLNTPHAPVAAFPTLFSIDVVGPAEEMLFLTCEEGDRAKSYMPLPKGPVGRPHVTWAAGPDIVKIRDWYADSFGLNKTDVIQEPVPGSTTGATMPNTVMMLKDPGNFVQFSGNPKEVGPRPHGQGQLPPGNAMASFGVRDLDALKLAYIQPPQPLYGTRRAATVLDPDGNRVELIEEAKG